MNPIILFDNRFQDGTPVATDTASGFDVLNIRDYRAYSFWKAASQGTKEIIINCGISKPADALGIVGHNLASVGASISVEISANGADWTEVLAPFYPWSNRAQLRLFTQVSGKYWKLKLAGCTAAPYLGEALIGLKIQFPYPPDGPYTPYTEEVEVDTAKSKTGNILGSVIRHHPIQIAPRFSNFLRTFAFGPGTGGWGEFPWGQGPWGSEWTLKDFWEQHASLMLPFFWVWDLSIFPQDIFWLKVKDDTQFAMPLSITHYVDSFELPMEGVRE